MSANGTGKPNREATHPRHNSTRPFKTVRLRRKFTNFVQSDLILACLENLFNTCGFCKQYITCSYFRSYSLHSQVSIRRIRFYHSAKHFRAIALLDAIICISDWRRLAGFLIIHNEGLPDANPCETCQIRCFTNYGKPCRLPSLCISNASTWHGCEWVRFDTLHHVLSLMLHDTSCWCDLPLQPRLWSPTYPALHLQLYPPGTLMQRMFPPVHLCVPSAHSSTSRIRRSRLKS